MRKNFIAGLIVFLPLVLTFIIASFLINLLTTPFLGIAQSLLTYYDINIPPLLLRTACQFMILLGFSLAVLVTGFSMQSFIVSKIVNSWERLILKIPFVGKVYRAAKDVVRTFFGPANHNFGTVVLAPFPHVGLFSIGLVTNEDIETKERDDDLISVYLPTTPNPTMGFLLMYRRDELIYTDMTVSHAFKGVVSCGLMLPSFNVTRLSHPNFR